MLEPAASTLKGEEVLRTMLTMAAIARPDQDEQRPERAAGQQEPRRPVQIERPFCPIGRGGDEDAESSGGTLSVVQIPVHPTTVQRVHCLSAGSDIGCFGARLGYQLMFVHLSIVVVLLETGRTGSHCAFHPRDAWALYEVPFLFLGLGHNDVRGFVLQQTTSNKRFLKYTAARRQRRPELACEALLPPWSMDLPQSL